MKLIATLLFLFFFSITFSQTAEKKKSKFSFFTSFKDSTNKHNHFELSFGQNLLFISSNKLDKILAQEAVVIPTSSILFFSEFRPQKTMRIPVFFNIATESKQYLVNGQLVNEKANPTIGSGLVFKFMEYRIDAKSKIEIEAGPLASLIFDKNKQIRIAPIVALRVKVCRGENFVMYLGTNYSFGVNAVGLMYGTGTVF